MGQFKSRRDMCTSTLTLPQQPSFGNRVSQNLPFIFTNDLFPCLLIDLRYYTQLNIT